jgi:hypothetical protein
MADVKISALPLSGTIVAASDALPIVNGGITAKTTPTAIVNAALPTVTANIVPSADNTYTLGTPSLRWEAVYIGPGSLYLQDTNNAALNVELTVTDGVLLINGTNTMRIGDFIFDENTIESTAGTVDIEIGLTTSTADIVLNRDTVVDASKTFTLGSIRISDPSPGNPTIQARNGDPLYLFGNTVTVEDDAGEGRLTCGQGGIAINSDATNITVTNGTIKLEGANVPAHSYGVAGDQAGMVAFDSTYMYYCTSNYVNTSTNIWKRVAWDTRTW